VKFRNISGVDLEVPAAGVIVPAGQVLDVDGPLADGMAGQDSVWAPVVARTKTKSKAPADPPTPTV